MRKYIKSIVIGIVSGLVIPVPVFAQSVIPNPIKINSLSELIDYVSKIVRPVILVVFLVVIMVGGWNYLTDSGDGKKIGTAKKMIFGGIIGFAIIVLAPVIVELVGGLLGVKGGLVDLGNPTTP